MKISLSPIIDELLKVGLPGKFEEDEDWTTVPFDVEYFAEARNILRKWREEHVRRSEETVEIWEFVLSRHPRDLGDELWLVYEQVCIAALDTARADVVVECIRALQAKFPRSNRVLKLQAMRLEALQRYDSATHLYEQLIESDPTNMSYRKRRIAILKARGERQEAIHALNDYLKVFINDTEAWLELSDLFLQEGDLARAAHCMEELILTNPHNSLYLRRLAEIRYTQGGQENTELAKSYFEQAVQTNPSCARSRYGIVLCCMCLSSKSSGQRKKDYVQTGLAALEKLKNWYDEANTEDWTEMCNTAFFIQTHTLESLKKQLES
ncbi:unnamed protein product [Gongylonema pulchrum]|uniref:ER membrane protein complex subunit 2 n=1 Tax=Gongylonema pulchrum TaxID=637853 RepID=A0A183DRM4_9BILA|nr:unnamed protein product [Gongylonema pulchrum]